MKIQFLEYIDQKEPMVNFKKFKSNLPSYLLKSKVDRLPLQQKKSWTAIKKAKTKIYESLGIKNFT